MDKKPYALIVIERLEYYITKEIERAMYNNMEEEKSFKLLYERITECLNARKELNYNPIYENVEDFLKNYGYDDNYINDFIIRVNIDIEETKIIDRICQLENKHNNKEFKELYVKLEKCVEERKKHHYDPILNDVEDALKKYGFKKSFIKKFLNISI
ncbi:hypothetical protein OXPF_01350 [Oxobacter pfennigii]|uniref:Uncharacterized protein n=1 Tax=Oxobacter pfennigii TaxID=36849 RepID=A0A0N8NTZ6_9CLOT|nr:hypothetical protein [Oxobacter pfennigii]KPU46216.1 hypothetical protein OXPF_01350 [Oxobacter pfennigii]